MMGAYYKNRLLGADYQLSWTRKSRAPVSYTVPGQFTERKVSLPALRGQLAGLDVSRSFSEKITFFIRAEGTILNQDADRFDSDRFTFDRFEASADVKPNKKVTITGTIFLPETAAKTEFNFFKFGQQRIMV